MTFKQLPVFFAQQLLKNIYYNFFLVPRPFPAGFLLETDY
jgi:hypothetical protein